MAKQVSWRPWVFQSRSLGCLGASRCLLEASWPVLGASWAGHWRPWAAIGRFKTASWSHLGPSHEHSCNPTVKNWFWDLSQRSLLKDVSNEITVPRSPGQNHPGGGRGFDRQNRSVGGDTEGGSVSLTRLCPPFRGRRISSYSPSPYSLCLFFIHILYIISADP